MNRKDSFRVGLSGLSSIDLLVENALDLSRLKKNREQKAFS